MAGLQADLGRRASVAILAVVATILLIAACSRGPAPPRPTEDLRPEIIAIIADASGPPFILEDGTQFPPSANAPVRRIKNWPANPADEDEPRPDSLLLGGMSDDGVWWYQLAGSGGPNTDDCWPVFGGAFDDGGAVWFSSGLRVPKAPDFEVRPDGSSEEDPFPAHQADFVCVDVHGQAVYLELAVGR